ncbi:MAG: SAM-dependent DNA methyltransferase [Pseudomonadota bacterium]
MTSPAVVQTGLGAAMVGGRTGMTGERLRQRDDFYPTPPEVFEALLRRMPHLKGQRIWDPECGDGVPARVMESHGCRVIATDLVDRGYGTGGVNFLAVMRPRAPVIITNPAYDHNHPAVFIEHAMRMHIAELWLLLKSTYWHAETRQSLYRRHRPKWKLELTWRPDFLGLGAPTMECAWFGWHRDWTRNETLHDLIARPVMGHDDLFAPPDPAARQAQYRNDNDAPAQLFDALI